jgi:hypothetical protein
MKTNKSSLLLKSISFLGLVFIVSVLTACGNTGEITVSQLTSRPDDYNENTVTVTGFYFDAFEMVALCDSLKPSTLTPGDLAPQEPYIWLKGGLPEAIRDKLYTQPMNAATGYPEHYGKVEITGQFQYGGQYGHLGSYRYQLSVTDAHLVDWSPTPGKQ